MKNFSALALGLALLLSAAASILAQEITPLPFSVSIAGDAAKVKSGEVNFARIDKPVANNAAFEVGAKGDMIIINIVPADEKGAVKEGATASIIILQNTTKSALDKTMDGKKLAPGNYLLAAVAEGKTASVFFKIQ